MLESLRELGDQELLAEIAGMFVTDAPSQITELREAVESETAEDVERTAHSLKGSSGNIGASRMSEICDELQDAGASEDLSYAPQLLGQLEAEFGRVRPALEDQIKEI